MTLQNLCRAAVSVGLLAGVASLVHAQDAARGAVLLAEAQQAIGGLNRIEGVKTLHATGTFRRVIGNNDTEGDFDVFLELPDKYLRSEKTGTPGQPSTERIEALVGTEVRDEVRGGGGGRGGGMGAGGDAPFGGGDPSPANAGDAAAVADDAAPQPAGDNASATAGAMMGRGRGGMAANPEAQRLARQADVSRLILMWLLSSNVPVAWVGVAESPDGNADVLEARFADGVPTRLFLDSATHMPLMMTWQGMPGRAGGPGARGGFPQRGRIQALPVLPDPDNPGAQLGGPPQAVDLEMTFSDHRAVNGIRLPHVVTRGIGGQTIERWTIRSYRVNPSFNPETFTR